MSRFFFISSILLLVAVVFTIAVWYGLQISLKKQMESIADVPLRSTPETTSTPESSVSDKEFIVEDVVTTSPVATEESIMLRDLPLTDSQRSMVESVGIDVETYTITPEMIACAKASLGVERYNAILGGEAPGFLEGTKLLGCMH